MGKIKHVVLVLITNESGTKMGCSLTSFGGWGVNEIEGVIRICDFGLGK